MFTVVQPYCVPVLVFLVKKFLKKKCEKEKALYVPPVYTVVIRWYIVVYIVVYVYDKKYCKSFCI